MNDKQHATILIVDDEDRNVRLLESLLTADGYGTLSAHDGRQALAKPIDRADLRVRARNLVRAAEHNDEETGHHVRRISHYCRVLACFAAHADRFAEIYAEHQDD